MADVKESPGQARADAIGRHYLIRFGRHAAQRPLWIRLIIEFCPCGASLRHSGLMGS